MGLALADVKVVEYGNLISAPFCSKLLADLGAEVIKIENPILPDIWRRSPPYAESQSGLNRSGVFAVFARGKKLYFGPQTACRRRGSQALDRDK